MKRWKFVIAETKLCAYILFFVYSIWSLQDQWDWFWSASKQHLVFEKVPWRLKSLYFMETAHYTYTLIAMFFEPKMKDRTQMICHHLFTILLLLTSYLWYTIGQLINRIHKYVVGQ